MPRTLIFTFKHLFACKCDFQRFTFSNRSDSELQRSRFRRSMALCLSYRSVKMRVLGERCSSLSRRFEKWSRFRGIRAFAYTPVILYRRKRGCSASSIAHYRSVCKKGRVFVDRSTDRAVHVVFFQIKMPQRFALLRIVWRRALRRLKAGNLSFQTAQISSPDDA